MQWLFALRYLISRSSHSVINIIAGVSLVSVAIPVAAMVILLSVFNGFEVLVKQMYADTDADIEVVTTSDKAETLYSQINDTKGVAAASIVVEGQALARSNNKETAVAVRGVDNNYFNTLPIDPLTLKGDSVLTLGEIDKSIITRDVAQMLGIYTIATTKITLFSINGGAIGSLMPVRGINEKSIWLGGIVPSSQQMSNTVIIPLRVAQQLFKGKDTKIYVRCSENSESVKSRLQESLSDTTSIRTREEKNSIYYQIMRYEKWAVFFVALLVLIIASLSIIGTVIMLIVEKRDQKLTLLAIGADSSFIRGIFVRQGLLISGIGGAIGLVLGIVIVLIQQYFGVITLPSETFVIESYPVRLQLIDIIMVFTTFVVIAWGASQIAANSMIKKQL
ncbi:MAG: ABC transporter permease [Alistipes sp.]|nr:ABC transporter permease [Alistipes sp.]